MRQAKQKREKSMIDCIYCGKSFTPQRNTAKYCNTACRVAFNRMPTSMKKQYELARDALTTMSQQFRRDERLASDYDNMLSMLQAIIIEQRKSVNHNQLSLFKDQN